MEIFQGFSPGQSSSKRTANKIADIPVPSGGPQDFPQTLHRAGVSSDLPDEANQGVFSTFPRVKKSAKIPRTQGSELGGAVALMDAMSLAGLEHGDQGDRHGCGYLLVDERQERSWLVLLLLVYPLTQWLEQPLVQAVHGCRLSAMEAFGRISSSTCLPCRVVRT